MDKKEKKNCKLTIMFWVAIIAILVCALGTILPCFGMSEIDKENAMVTFIGVLAAFIVINNFSQVADIQHRTESGLKRIDEELKLKTDELNGALKRTSEKIDALISGEMDEYYIKEKYKNDNVKSVTLIEKAVSKKYYVVEFYHQQPVIVFVHGKKNDLKIDEVPFKDYINRFTNKDDLDDLNSILGSLGIK